MSAIAPSQRSSSRPLLGSAPAVRRAVLAAMVLAIGCWSVLVAGWRMGQLHPPLSGTAMQLLFYGLPLSLVTLLAWRPPLRTRELAAATAWTTALAAAFAFAPHLTSTSTYAIAVPAVLLAAWIVALRPELAVSVLVIFTGFYGSLQIYFHFHYLKLSELLIGALWLAAIGKLVLFRRAGRMWAWTGAIGLLGYLIASLVAVAVSSDQHGALAAFENAPAYISICLVIAYSGWSTEAHARITNAVLAVALAVGAYATFRYIVGPSHQEFALARTSAYNFVDGKLKLLGSFTSGQELGAWSAMMLPFCLACALGWRGRFRLAAIAAIPLLALALIGSQLRTGAVAALLAALVTLILYQVARAYPSGVRIGVGALAAISAVVVGLGAFTIVASRGGGLGSRYTALLTLNSQDVSFSEHRYKWNAALRDLSGHPFGYGIGTAVGDAGQLPKVGANQVTPVNSFGVDSGYLKIALEQGLIVMALYAVSLLLILGGLARRGVAATDPRRATIAIGAAGALTALLVLEGSGGFDESFAAIATWIVVGLGIAQFQGRRPRRPAAVSD